MEFKTTTAGIDRDLRNHRSDDQLERAAIDGALAIVARQTFDPAEQLKVSCSASEDEISVTVAKA